MIYTCVCFDDKQIQPPKNIKMVSHELQKSMIFLKMF